MMPLIDETPPIATASTMMMMELVFVKKQSVKDIDFSCG